LLPRRCDFQHPLRDLGIVLIEKVSEKALL
jgi:hypothetical protein